MVGGRISRKYRLGRRALLLVGVLVVLTIAPKAVLFVSGDSSGSSARDPFVAASPLVVALACRDGVALVAAHTSDTPLLYRDDDDDDDDDDEHQHEEEGYFRELPGNFCGPLRLHSVSRQTALLTAGWRADAARLVDAARAMDANQQQTFGDEKVTPYVLASDLSNYMAICAGGGGGAVSWSCRFLHDETIA